VFRNFRPDEHGTMIPDWSGERSRMVETQLRRRGIHDPRVLAAMGEIPREQFVPPEGRVLSYTDAPVPIGWGQTISQPYMTALMADLLGLQGTETVLEVGTGCGYAAAVLGALAAHVITVELLPGLARFARENLHRTGRDRNITVVEGDGSMGYPPLAPYDAISVAAGAPEIPASLVEQLRDPGIMVIPVGDRDDQELCFVRKENGRVETEVRGLCRFVPLRGGEGWR
jgi:protein-L-isoaspartate(D-aspartate) O-methyltransferase